MTIENEIAMLARLPVLGQLEDEALRVLAFAADSVSFSTGDFLFKQGDLSTGGFFIASGSVELVSDHRELKVIEPGALIGEMALIAQTRLRHSARAREPVSALRINRSLFTRILREYPGSAVKVRAAIAASLDQFARDLSALEAVRT